MLLPEASYFIVGGAGFIGSHFTDALLASPKTRRVTIFDNFTSGREWHYEGHSLRSAAEASCARMPVISTRLWPPWKAMTG